MHDHRKLGRELGPVRHRPADRRRAALLAARRRRGPARLEEYLRELERRAGYQHVYSPVLGKRELYEISGHWSHYRDDMYPPMD